MQSSFLKLCVLFIFVSAFAACTQAPDFDIAPEITFLSMSKNTMIQDQSNTDSLFLRINFKDGDGDLGTDVNSTKQNIFLVDSRTDVIAERFKIPPIPAVGKQEGIEGEISLKVFTTCCRFENANPCESNTDTPTNEFHYEIFMIDDAGNESNRIQSSTLTLICD